VDRCVHIYACGVTWDKRLFFCFCIKIIIMTTWDELSGVALAMQLVASPRVCQLLKNMQSTNNLENSLAKSRYKLH
jgi:hypothetical protein